jgi:hypothetical protein
MSDAGTSSTSSIPHAMEGAAEDITYPLSPSGDLTLVITNTAEPDRQRALFASSQVLMESSRYFAAMLNPAYGSAEFQTRRINFIDDDFTALMLVLRALHKQDDLLEAVKISEDNLYGVAVLCDKYGLADCGVVKSWATRWIDALKLGFRDTGSPPRCPEGLGSSTMCSDGLRSLESWLRVGCVFIHRDIFRFMIWKLLFVPIIEFEELEFEGLPDSISGMPNSPFPSKELIVDKLLQTK